MKRSYQWLLVLLLSMTLLLSATPAFAAEAEAAPKIIWTDVSYTKYLLNNLAFYDLDEQVLAAEDVPEIIKALQKTDPWAQYYSAEEYAISLSGHEGDFVGIGVYLRQEGEQVLVVGVIAGSPAEKAGLTNGDIIVEVDGENMREASINELQQALRGKENTILTIKYQRNGKTSELMMNRKRITVPSIEYWLMEDNIAYVRIEQFTAHTGEELRAGLASLSKQGMTSLMVDLRDCPGGLIDGAVEVSAQLAGSGPMLFYVDNRGWLSFDAIDEDEAVGIPLAVLINRYTASAAELLAANIQDMESGILIGEASYGKGVVQSLIKLPSGAAISFTTGKYISHGYQDIFQQGGVLPDLYEKDEDAQQERAAAWLKEQLNQAISIQFYTSLSGYVLGNAQGNNWHNSTATLLIDEDSSFVPMKLTLTTLGWEIEEREGLIYAENGNWRLIVDVANQTVITGDGKYPLLQRKGEPYLPAALLRYYGHTVTWNAGERSVVIEK